MMMMHLSLAALLASCSAFAPKPLRGTPRRHAKRQSLQMNVITERPARAALAAAYVGFAGAIAAFPGEFNNPADIQLIQDALNDPTSMTVHKSNCYVRLILLVMVSTPSTRRQLDGVAAWSLTDRFS